MNDNELKTINKYRSDGANHLVKYYASIYDAEDTKYRLVFGDKQHWCIGWECVRSWGKYPLFDDLPFRQDFFFKDLENGEQLTIL